MRSLRQLVSNFRSRPKVHLAVLFVAVSNHLGVVALAATPAVLNIPSIHVSQSACGPDSTCDSGTAAENANLSLPGGTSQCHDSGPAAACSASLDGNATAPGTTAPPAGTNACAAIPNKPVPTTAATCANAVIGTDAPSRATGSSQGPIAPSVPVDSLGARLPTELALTATSDAVKAGKPAILTATASSTVTGTDRAIEIYDVTAGTLVAACGQGSQCSVAYTATAGLHDFVAFVGLPTSTMPNGGVALLSNHVRVGWLDSRITANQTIVGPGQPITLTATSTFDVQQSGRWLEIYDLTAGHRITYCSRGTACTTTIKETAGGVHAIVAYVTGKPEAVSTPINATWLRVSLAATSIGPKTGGTVNLKATANADLSSTPWVMGVYDQNGNLVDHVCKTGSTCSVHAWMDGKGTPSYTAVIGAVPDSSPGLIQRITHNVGAPSPLPLVDVQTRSAAVEPTHLLWGVDSCKAFTGDPTGELFWSVVKHLGTPDFWGRYLTDTVCPGISSGEAALAAKYHMGILPIYNDYNCSNVSYYATGRQYAAAAVGAAQRLGIPSGRAIAIDIEPPGDACPGAASVDSGFIEGWYDGVHAAGYVPTYYGNGTSGSEFASAWCGAVSAIPNIGTDSALWSFQPSLLGDFSKSSNPGYAPYGPSCGGNMVAWQFVLSAGSNPDVDQDEALSSLPLWYPS